jgi:hypothetical protein
MTRIWRAERALVRAAFINGPREVALLREVLAELPGAIDEAQLAGDAVMSVYYRLWGDKSNLGTPLWTMPSRRLARNPSITTPLVPLSLTGVIPGRANLRQPGKPGWVVSFR